MTLFQKKLIFFEPFIYLFAWPFHHCFFTLSTEDKIHASIQASGYWSSIKSNKMRKKTYWILYFYTASTLKGFNWMFWKHVSAIICSLTWLTAHSLSETSFRFSILIYSLWQNSYRLPAFFFPLYMISTHTRTCSLQWTNSSLVHLISLSYSSKDPALLIFPYTKRSCFQKSCLF